MEQYFEITKESAHYKEYFDYLEANEACKKSVKSFFNENNIHTNCHVIFREALYIDDNPENREKYGNQLMKHSIDGVVAFKKKSKIGRAWIKSGIKRVNKLNASSFFAIPSYSSTKTRLFHVGEKLYCRINCLERNTKVNTPQGFIEMKASEFLKLLNRRRK